MSTKLLGVISLLSFLLIVGVLVVQYLEWQYFGAPPSVWPMP